MRTTRILAFALAVLTAPVVAADDESAEPALTYKLTVDGKEHPIEAGKPIEIAGKFENPKVALSVPKVRTFSYGGLKFDYPASFMWEAEVDPLIKTWTLDGNDLTVLIFAPIVSMTFDDMIAEMKEQLGGKDGKSEKSKRRFGNEELEGEKFSAKAFGATVAIEAYRIKTAKGPRLIMFQDSIDEGETQSAEAAAAIKVITESFSVGK